MRRRHYQAGDIIFQEGEASTEAFIIHSGCVEIVKATAEGDAHLAKLGPDEVLGEMGLLEERPRSASARALDDVVASSVNHDEFVTLILENPQEGMSLIRALFERLRTMNQLVIDYQTAAGSAAALAVAAAPTVQLFPASPETAAVVPNEGLVIDRFPYRIGRQATGQENAVFAFNDLSVEDNDLGNVSLNHCALDLDGEGLLVRDRGSRHATRINGTKIGAQAFRQSTHLKSGENELVLGAADSPYRFRIVVGG